MGGAALLPPRFALRLALTPRRSVGQRLPERFVAKGRDGVTDIHALVIRPTTFDADRLASHEVRFIAHQEDCCRRDVLGFAEAAHGDVVRLGPAEGRDAPVPEFRGRPMWSAKPATPRPTPVTSAMVLKDVKWVPSAQATSIPMVIGTMGRAKATTGAAAIYQLKEVLKQVRVERIRLQRAFVER